MKTNWNVAAIVAWRGYLKEGRGAVAIVCRSAWSPPPGTPWSFGPTHDAYYIPYSALQEQDTEAWPGAEGIAALTNSYNPEREVVFIFFRDDRGVSVYRMEPHKGLPPPAAYARWQAGHVPANGALSPLRRLANFITQLTAL